MRPESEAEFREYVNARREPLRRFAYLVCGDWYRAEDVVQTVFIKLYTRWGRLRDTAAIEPYVRRMIVNALNDIRRNSWFRRERPSQVLPELAARDAAEGSADRDMLLKVLAQLPVRRRATLVLRFWEDRSVEETARILNCSTSTVKSQTARGLDTLRGLMSESTFTTVEGQLR